MKNIQVHLILSIFVIVGAQYHHQHGMKDSVHLIREDHLEGRHVTDGKCIIIIKSLFIMRFYFVYRG